MGAIWGCSFWWIKLGLRAVSPVDVAFARLTAGAVTLLLVSALSRTHLPRRAATWGHLFVLAVFFNSAPFTLFAYGETRISAVLAGIINALAPLATLVAALTIFRQQRPNLKIAGGLVVGFAGVLILAGAAISQDRIHRLCRNVASKPAEAYPKSKPTSNCSGARIPMAVY